MMGAMIPYEQKDMPAQKEMCDKFVTPFSDEKAMNWIERHGAQTSPDARRIAEVFRKETSSRCGSVSENESLHGLFQPGCSFKSDIPKMGPCWGDFRQQQGLKFSDSPTESALVSMIPMPLLKTLNMTMPDQVDFLQGFVEEKKLPDWLDISFGPPVYVAGMAMMHSHATGRDIFHGKQVRTDTCDQDGDRVVLHRRGGKLACGLMNQDKYQLPNTAIFIVAVIKSVIP